MSEIDFAVHPQISDPAAPDTQNRSHVTVGGYSRSTGMFEAIGVNDEGNIYCNPLSLSDGLAIVPDTVSTAKTGDIDLPLSINGSISVVLTLVDGATPPSARNDLIVSVTPYIYINGVKVVMANNSVTLLASGALTWVSGSTYMFQITSPFGPCHGVRISLTSASVGTGKTIDATAYLIAN